MIDVGEFDKLFNPDPVGAVKEVFGVPAADLKPHKLVWKGKTVTVYDREMFMDLIRSWMKQDGITKEEALDLFFEMI